MGPSAKRRAGRRPLHVVILTALLVGACSAPIGADTSNSASADRTPTVSAAPPSPDVSSSATPRTPTSGPAVTPSLEPRPSESVHGVILPHVDPALEALLPDRIGDVVLVRMSAPGSDSDGGTDMCSWVCPGEASAMARAAGARLEDVTLAFAIDAGQPPRYGVVAFRIGDETGKTLLAARLSAYGSEPPYPVVAERRVGDDSVTVAILGWQPNETQFLVVRDEALIVIPYPTPKHDGSEPTLPDEVARIVAALP